MNRFTKGLLGVGIVGLSIGLAGCGMRRSAQNNAMVTPPGDAQGIYSQGVQGSGGNFNGQAVGNQQGESGNNLAAPQNKSYFFAFDDSGIRNQAYGSLKAQAKYLAAHPSKRVILQGNTDERGSREYNLALGERRADAIADVLMVNGVKNKQILVVSFGQEKPEALGHNAKAWRENRRVDLKYCVRASGKCL